MQRSSILFFIPLFLFLNFVKCGDNHPGLNGESGIETISVINSSDETMTESTTEGSLTEESVIADFDGDEIADSGDNCPQTANPNQENQDGDTMGDLCDPCPKDAENDIDQDGICGDIDSCPKDAANDIDQDGLCGNLDNCPTVANPDQSDTDGNGTGDLCETWIRVYSEYPSGFYFSGFFVKETGNEYLILGRIFHTETHSYDLVALKANLFGDIIREKTFFTGTFDVNWIDSAEETADQGYIMTGTFVTQTPASSEYLIVKTDKNYDIEWQRIWGAGDGSHDYSHTIHQTADGGYVFSGDQAITTDPTAAWFAKLSPLGEPQWEHMVSTSRSAFPGDLAQEKDNTFLVWVTKYQYYDSVTHWDIIMMAFDAVNNNLWEKRLTNAQSAGVNYAQKIDDGNYIIVGNSYESFSSPAKILFMKVSPEGNVIWQQSFGSSDQRDCAGRYFRETRNKKLVIVGFWNGDAAIVKTDSEGNLLWQRNFHFSNASSTGYYVNETSDGGFIITGSLQYQGLEELILIKTDSEGNVKGYNGAVPLEPLSSNAPSMLNLRRPPTAMPNQKVFPRHHSGAGQKQR